MWCLLKCYDTWEVVNHTIMHWRKMEIFPIKRAPGKNFNICVRSKQLNSNLLPPRYPET
jgi:hypothetical protein